MPVARFGHPALMGQRLLRKSRKRTVWPWIALIFQGLRDGEPHAWMFCMNGFLREVAHAWRGLRKRPGFTTVAIASIALGMAVNATVFGWVERVLISPIPGIRDASRIVAIQTAAPDGEWIDSSYPDARDIARSAHSFRGVTAFRQQPLYLGEGRGQMRVWAETVSGNFFDVLGVQALAGRTFNQAEQADRPAGAPVAVISEQFWRSHYRADPSVLGSVVRLNRQPLTIIGVVPAAFEGAVPGLRFDFYVPLTMLSTLTGSRYWLEERDSRPLAVFGRLADGVSLAQANAELSAIGHRLSAAFPDSNRTLGFLAMSIADSKDGVQHILKGMLQVLLVLGLAVMVIVCANVGNLLLARAMDRQREFSIRLSLGASRSRLVTQLLAEALLLTLVGSAAGILASTWMTGAINLLLPPSDLPLARLDGGFGWMGAAFTGVLALMVTVFCALAPAVPILRGQASALRDGGRGSSASRRTRRLRDGLVMAEVALATVALVGCGLFVRSFQNAREANPGFEPRGVLLAGLDFAESGYTRDQGRAALVRLRDQLNRTPGIRKAALVEDVPLGFSAGSWEQIEVEGYSPAEGENMKIWRDVISPGYFDAMRIPLETGRDFDARDRRETQAVAIVNQTFVKRFFGGREAIGRKFHGWGREITVVGVARDSRIRTLSEAPAPYFYVPLDQFWGPGMGLGVVARTQGAPERFDGALRAAIQEADPGLAITGTATFLDFIGASYLAQKVGASLLSAIGALALLLAMIGLYGVMLYSISRRVQEIGIRMAVGARPEQVLRQVLREGFLLGGAGVAAGLGLAAAAGRLVSSLLYGVDALDPATFGIAAAGLLACAVASAWAPAWRASRVDPIVALRWE